MEIMKKPPLRMQVRDITGKHFIDNLQQAVVPLVKKDTESRLRVVFGQSWSPETLYAHFLLSGIPESCPCFLPVGYFKKAHWI